MNYPSWWQNAEPGVTKAIDGFTEWLSDKIKELKPHILVGKKNPFLFCAKSSENASQLAESLIDAFLSSSEETRFGDIIEEIAIAICESAKGGRKSSTTGIDLEYDDKNERTIMQIKSSVNWGNSSQRKKLESDFKKAAIVLRKSQSIKNVRAIEGVCYGPSKTVDKGGYYQIVGKDFWKELSGWSDAGTAALHVIEQHAGNGLRDARKSAQKRIVDYLKRSKISKTDGTVNWEVMLELAMMKPNERPK